MNIWAAELLRSVRYKNFKRYKDVTLDLSKPITILVGPNSSGKSSLLKGLLAFKQTYDDPADHAGFVAQGEYVDIGNFEEYVNNHQTHKEVSFTFEVSGYQRYNLRQGRQNLPPIAYVKVVQEEDPQTKHGRVAAYNISFSEPDSVIDDSDHDYWILYSRMQKSDEYFKVSISVDLYLLVRQLRGRPDVNPESFRDSYSKVSQRLAKGEVQAVRDNQRGMISNVVRGGDFLTIDTINYMERFIVQPVHSQLFADLTQNLFALAALREKPARSAKRTDERRTVGSAGQNTTSVYFALRQRATKSGNQSSRLRETLQRLDGWFSRLKLGREIEINSWRDLIDMRTRNSGASSDSVVDVGVGFSQAAPILVQLAAMPDGSGLITEQPELHLYPWAQTRLGQVFCEEAHRGDKRIIIETHSEHLIQGVQLHISEHRSDKGSGLTPLDVQILYVDENSDVTELGLDEYGELTGSWPQGFFDQTIEVFRTIVQNKQK